MELPTPTMLEWQQILMDAPVESMARDYETIWTWLLRYSSSNVQPSDANPLNAALQWDALTQHPGARALTDKLLASSVDGSIPGPGRERYWGWLLDHENAGLLTLAAIGNRATRWPDDTCTLKALNTLRDTHTPEASAALWCAIYHRAPKDLLPATSSATYKNTLYTLIDPNCGGSRQRAQTFTNLAQNSFPGSLKELLQKAMELS